MFSRIGCHQSLYLTCFLCFWTSVKALTVLEGQHVVFPLKTVVTVNNSELYFMEIEWRFNLHHKNKLLAMLKKTIEENRTDLILDNRFQVTENGSLVLEDARFQDAGDYICKVIRTNGIFQTHTINLQVQPQNISDSTLHKGVNTTERDSTCTQRPDAKGQGASLKRTVIIACSVTAAVVFLVCILSGIIYRCRKTDEGIYANIPKERNTAAAATASPTARTV